MKKYKNHTLKEYLQVLSARTPVPGGGSAAALTAALGTALLAMVAQYSLGKNSSKRTEGRIKVILRQSEKIRDRLLELVDLDAQAYLQVVRSRRAPWRVKQSALREARRVPREVCRLCYSAVQLAPDLVAKGNRYLISDVEVAVEFLTASFQSALVNVRINQ